MIGKPNWTKNQWTKNQWIRRSLLGAAGLILFAGVIWLAITAFLVRKEVTALKAELPQLRSEVSAGQLDQAQATSKQLAAHAHRAHTLTSGPAWWVASELPWVGEPVDTVRTIAAQSDVLGHDVLPGVLELATNLTSGNLRNGNQVDLSQLVSAAPVLAHAQTAATHATEVVSQLPHHTILGSVDSARTTVETQLGEIRNQLQAASRAAQILPPMLGQDGPKRYFVGFINEGEMRGVGGLPGAFGILLADHGKLSFESFQNDTSLDGYSASVDLGADYKAAYGRDDPTLLYINSDVSPDFTSAAQIWASMWQKKSGEKIDGAIALDPTALSYLLGATGPATTADGVVVNADNVVSLTQQQLYSQFATDTTARKAYLLTVAEAISHKLLGGGDVKDLARAGAKAAQQRRLLIWSSDATVEDLLTQSGYAGLLPGSSAPATGFSVVNAAGTKLDYYLDRTMSYARTSCDAGTASATMVLHNDAPASGLPPYVTTRYDSHAAAAKPGDNRELVTYYGSAGSTIVSVTLNGKPISYSAGKEKGLTLMTVDLELPVGSTQTIVVTVNEPASTQAVQVLKQPGVRPLKVDVTQPSCAG